MLSRYGSWELASGRVSHLFSGSSSCSSLQDSSSDCNTVDFSTDSSHLRSSKLGKVCCPQPRVQSHPPSPRPRPPVPTAWCLKPLSFPMVSSSPE